MTGLLLDTNAYAAITNGNADALTLIYRAASLSISIVSIGELYAGFVSGTREQRNRQLLNDFLKSSGVRVLPVLNATAEAYAQILKVTRAAGRPIPTNDIWIAATAIEHSLPLFTYDRHFVDIPQLRAVSSLAELESI